jgi:predicted nucleotide-binding protein (sugar kinase/HSP70/actin superfamily)
MTYNFDEEKGDNHYNCPVVAYYPQLLSANVEQLSRVRFLYPYLTLDHPKQFEVQALRFFRREFPQIPRGEIRRAARAG